MTSAQVSPIASLSSTLGPCSNGQSVCRIQNPDTTHIDGHQSNSIAFLLLATGVRRTAGILGHAVPIPAVNLELTAHVGRMQPQVFANIFVCMYGHVLMHVNTPPGLLFCLFAAPHGV